MTVTPRILMIEDDESIRNLTRMHLRMNGFPEVALAVDGEEGLKVAEEFRPDLILLDIMLPGIDGLTVLRNLRNHPILCSCAIILLTAKGEENDIVLGLELGADDYVTNPFSSNVLLARIRNQFRKQNVPSQTPIICLGGLTLNTAARTASLNASELTLTADEFDTLALLMRTPEKVFTRRRIIEAVKGGDYPATDRVVDIRMMKLRKKLGPWAEHVETVRGVGYKITGF